MAEFSWLKFWTETYDFHHQKAHMTEGLCPSLGLEHSIPHPMAPHSRSHSPDLYPNLTVTKCQVLLQASPYMLILK